MATNRIVLRPGQRGKVIWQANKTKGGAPVSASMFDGKRVSKIILPESNAPCAARPGETWHVEILRDTNPKANARGAFEVTLLKRVFTLDLGPQFWIDQDVASEIAQDVLVRANVMLVGPQGCGKSTLANAIAKSLGMEFRMVDAAGIKRRSEWFAIRDVRSDGQGGQEIIWIHRPLAEALVEAANRPDKEFLIFIDELNRSSLDARNALLTIIYGEERSVQLPWGETVAVGDNIFFMAAINEGTEFGGVEGMDAAFSDRWARHKVGYPPENDEVRLLAAREAAANRDDLIKVVKIANSLREAAIRGEIPLQISMRMTQTCARRLAYGSSLKRAVISGILNQFTGDHDDKSSDAGIVWLKVKGRHGLS